MAWVLAYTDDGDPYYYWDGEGEIPEGETHPPLPVGPEAPEASQPPGEALTDPIIDQAMPTQVRVSPLRVKENNPLQDVADILDQAIPSPKPRPGIGPGTTSPLVDEPVLTLGKTPEQRAPLPTFTEMFPTPFDDVSFAGDVLPPKQRRAVVDTLASPFVRAYQAGTGRMSPMQQRNFALNAGVGAVGGGPIGAALGSLIGAAQAEEGPPQTPQALIPFHRGQLMETAGGPALLTAEDLQMWGILGAASLGFAFGPRVARKFISGAVPRLGAPRLRPVGENAAPGTLAMSTPMDLARSVGDDINAGLVRQMRRAERLNPNAVNPGAAGEVENILRLQTRTTTNALTEAAVNVGRMELPSYTFRVPTPLSQLKVVETPEVNQYLHLLDTIDQIKLESKLGSNMGQTGTPTVLGMDLQAADQLRLNLIAAHPELPNIAKVVNENLRAMRKFQSTGEYATIPAKDRPNTPLLKQRSAAFLNAERRNEIPWPGGRVTGEPVDRGSAVDNLSVAMRERLRHRMENEAVGMYVDHMRKIEPDLFVRVTNAQLAKNPNWNRNVVSFYRRGRLEKYTTDVTTADLLRMDPYYMTGMWQNIGYGTKRMLEITTTGELAPWFAPVSLMRSHGIGKLTMGDKDQWGPTILGSAAAIPQQLYPQLAKEIAPRLDHWSGGWMGKVFGQANLQGFAQRLASQYDRSLFAQLEAAGGGRGSIMQQQTQLNSRLTAAWRHKVARSNTQLARAAQEVGGYWGNVLDSYRAMLNAVHNAPSFNAARRNAGYSRTTNFMDEMLGRTRPQIPITELAADARHMTGDPRIGGQFLVQTPGGRRPIRFEDRDSRVSHTLGKVAQVYGGVSEAARTVMPWWNATTQGIKRLGEAYLDNPEKFIARMWMYELAPAASIYLYAKSLGKDPNGIEYTDYMMNRRTEYDKLMNYMIPIPGRPAEQGIRWSRFHETSIAGHLMEVAMDHAHRSNLFTPREDFARAAGSYTNVLTPAVPPAYNLALASVGRVAPSGPFGDSYQRHESPFDQTGGLPTSIDLYARAVAGGIADIVGEGYAAYTQTPEGFLSKLQNGSAAMVRRVQQKTPFVREITGQHPTISGNTGITEELFRKDKVLKQLASFYSKEDRRGGQVGVTLNSSGSIRDAGSQGGNIMAVSHLGPRPPREPAGIQQPKPNNPLYQLFMQMVHNRLIKDSPWTGTPAEWEKGRKGEPTGALGQKSIWARYSMATQNLRELRKVNEGNMVAWKRQMSRRPEQMEYLRERGVDPFNIRAVRNFYEKQRQDIGRTLLFNIKGVENELSEMAGRPIKLEDLQPYLGKPAPESETDEDTNPDFE